MASDITFFLKQKERNEEETREDNHRTDVRWRTEKE